MEFKIAEIKDKTGNTIYKAVKKFIRESGLNFFHIVVQQICLVIKMDLLVAFNLKIQLLCIPTVLFTDQRLHSKMQRKKYPYVVRYESILLNVHNYFSKSAIRTEKLRRIKNPLLNYQSILLQGVSSSRKDIQRNL
eukprot:TRINITY_DN7658_c0_g1_i3.p1 TRINITY_DN7658_c0_g1~~TRINITY_DN7658_c0_g1_i3.p1  ORF type:complete len:136 (-),score=6.21 TRINITY_DN7658_c0_g1_i3:145-552(-)